MNTVGNVALYCTKLLVVVTAAALSINDMPFWASVTLDAISVLAIGLEPSSWRYSTCAGLMTLISLATTH